MLQHCGATVTSASSAEEALEIFKAGDFDAVVSDLTMPGRDGYWLMEQLRAVAKRTVPRRIAAIAVTGVDRNDRDRALACGFNEFLQKPVDPTVVCERVAALVA